MNKFRKLFNDNWKFIEDENIVASAKKYEDSSWRTLCVPHDWSIENPYDKDNGDGATAYLTGGIGWYRKHFNLGELEDKTVYIHFDGVYNNSEMWINGERLGFHPYGYSPFYYDITKYLENDDNVLAVKVDRTRYVDSRWYTGSGIYRDVQIAVLNNIHIPIWGTFITTPKVSKKEAEINLELKVKNNYSENKNIDVLVQIYDIDNNLVLRETFKKEIKISDNIFDFKFDLAEPKLWGLDEPNLYTCIVELVENDVVLDQYSTKFGIRDIYFDKDKGFFLNDENMKIKGVCLHHDAGLVGAAVPKDVWRRRFAKLKEAGCNAIRCAHNPMSSEFLDLCDEMGILVQDEFFDEWDNPKDKRLNGVERHDDYLSRGYDRYFQEWAEMDLKATMLSHRNHPSVFQWSIGNEIEWTYPRNVEATGFFDAGTSGNYFWTEPPHSIEQIREKVDTLPKGKYDIGETAKKLSKWTKEMDTSRPVIANCILPSASFEAGYTDALDIVGFSYRRVIYDYAKRNYPDKICMGTENLGQWHDWKAILERDFISGLFLWTGIDYLGEAHHNGEEWPTKSLGVGLLDLAGFENDSYYMMKSLWNDTASIYIASQTAEKSMFKESNGEVVEKDPGAWEQLLWKWHDVNRHWNYTEGESIIVEVYSNCPEVELFLNNKSLGKKKLESFEDHIYKWAVPFSNGELKAVGIKDIENTEFVINSSESAGGIRLTIDKAELNVNQGECSHIVAQLIDKNGVLVITEEKELEFEIIGDIINLGVDNGSRKNVQDHKSNKIKTSQGKALMILQESGKAGEVKIKAKYNNITSNELNLIIK